MYIEQHPQGAIRFLNTNEDMCIFINDTTFRSCYTDFANLSGGSFYWKDYGSVVQYRKCYHTSWCSQNGQAYGTSISNNCINHCNFTSLFNIGIDEHKYAYSIGQSKGNVFINNNNQTLCRCVYMAGFVSNFANSVSTLFSNFINLNSQTFQAKIISIGNQKTITNLEHNNIINCSSTYTLLFFGYTNKTIINSCIIKDNNSPYLIIFDHDTISTISNMYIENISQILGNPTFNNTKSVEGVINEILPHEIEVCLRKKSQSTYETLIFDCSPLYSALTESPNLSK